MFIFIRSLPTEMREIKLGILKVVAEYRDRVSRLSAENNKLFQGGLLKEFRDIKGGKSTNRIAEVVSMSLEKSPQLDRAYVEAAVAAAEKMKNLAKKANTCANEAIDNAGKAEHLAKAFELLARKGVARAGLLAEKVKKVAERAKKCVESLKENAKKAQQDAEDAEINAKQIMADMCTMSPEQLKQLAEFAKEMNE